MLRRRRPHRPTLTLSITTRDAQERLGMLLAEAQLYADEIVVGVDRDSTDDTWAVACAGADRVFGFQTERGITSPGRLAGLERASCDWILWLDDDEGMDAAFPELRDELLQADDVAHWLLPRKWLTSFDPPRHLLADPWWPNYALRLARADPTRVWKPLRPHSGLRVVGPRGLEPRTAILHYERLDHDDAARALKVARYSARGSTAFDDYHYETPPDAPRAAVEPPPLRMPGAPAPRRRGARVDAEIDDFRRRPQQPGWAADVRLEMPARARAGEIVIVAARARNHGTLRWSPPVNEDWPILGLSYRVYTAGGEQLPDLAPRTRVGRDVLPRQEIDLLCRARMPEQPGDYVFVWQFLSEHECWFDELGSPATSHRVTVT